MATPDYLQQVVIARDTPISDDTGQSTPRRLIRRPTATGAIWACLDLMTVVVGGMMAGRIATHDAAVPVSMAYGHLASMPSALFGYVVAYGICLVLFSRSYGLYGPIQSCGGLHEQRMTLQASLVAGLILCGTLFVAHNNALSRSVALLTIALATVLLCTRRAGWRWMVYARYREGLETRNILILGTGTLAHALRKHLESLRHMGFRFRGFVALTSREAEEGGPDVIGSVANCVAVARSLFVDEIFISLPADRQLVMNLLDQARTAGIDVRAVPDLYDGLAWNSRVEYIGQFPTIPLHRESLPKLALLTKRVLDVVISSLALLVASPVLLAIALAVRLDSAGPILYRAARVGLKGRNFTCYKFRTMVPNADKLKDDLQHMNEREGVLFKIVNDPRVTKVGRVLRKYSLDELPQFFNVLRGDMSLVGPRPPIASEVEQYGLQHLRRLDVLPGITGLWQVEARQDPSFDSYISLDAAYIENWNVWLDLKILVRTVGVVFSGTGS